MSAKIDDKQTQFDKVSAEEKANNVSTIESEIDKLRSHYVDLLQQKTDIKNQITMKTHDDQQLEERLESQRKRIATATADLKRVQAQLDEKRQTLVHAKAELAEVSGKLADLTKLRDTRKQAVDSSQSNWLAALKIAEQAKAKAESLQNLHDSYRGFYRGVANLLKRKMN